MSDVVLVVLSGSVDLLSRPRRAAADGGVGRDDRGRAELHHHRLVDHHLPRPRHRAAWPSASACSPTAWPSVSDCASNERCLTAAAVRNLSIAVGGQRAGGGCRSRPGRGRSAGPGGRKRLGQDHHLPRADAPAACRASCSIASGSIRLNGRDLAPLSEDADAQGPRRGDRDDLPEPQLAPRSRHAHRRSDRRKRALSRRRAAADARARAVDLLRQVGIPDPGAAASDAYPHEFSGGMRQRAMIAVGPGLPAEAADRR